MNTKLAIAAALLVCGVSSLALAQEKSLEEIDKRTNRIFQTEGIQQEQYTRVVPSGTKQRIQYYYASNPDCTASGDVIVRITKEPEQRSKSPLKPNSLTSKKTMFAPSAMSRRFALR